MASATGTPLVSLNIRSNQIGDQGAEALARKESLTSLNVRSNKLSGTAATALAANSSLLFLDVGHNAIEEKGVLALAKNTSLASLEAERCKINSTGIATLAANTTLVLLNIGANNVDTKGKEVLSANKSLLKLSDNWGASDGPRYNDNISERNTRNMIARLESAGKQVENPKTYRDRTLTLANMNVLYRARDIILDRLKEFGLNDQAAENLLSNAEKYWNKFTPRIAGVAKGTAILSSELGGVTNLREKIWSYISPKDISPEGIKKERNLAAEAAQAR